MAEIHLQNLAHSYSPTPTGPEDYAIREMNHVWEQGGAYALLGPVGLRQVNPAQYHLRPAQPVRRARAVRR